MSLTTCDIRTLCVTGVESGENGNRGRNFGQPATFSMVFYYKTAAELLNEAMVAVDYNSECKGLIILKIWYTNLLVVVSAAGRAVMRNTAKQTTCLRSPRDKCRTKLNT